MVNKEDCVKSINNFIQSPTQNNAMTLLNYLCEIKEVPDINNLINIINNNVFALTTLIPNILEQLEKHFNLVRVTDKNNRLITVY